MWTVRHGYTGLATALGNFEQGNIEAESAVAASGLRVAMSRTGWHLLSPRFMLLRKVTISRYLLILRTSRVAKLRTVYTEE